MSVRTKNIFSSLSLLLFLVRCQDNISWSNLRDCFIAMTVPSDVLLHLLIKEGILSAEKCQWHYFTHVIFMRRHEKKLDHCLQYYDAYIRVVHIYARVFLQMCVTYKSSIVAKCNINWKISQNIFTSSKLNI